MSHYDFHNEFHGEKAFVSACFVLMLVVVGGLYVAQHAHELLVITAQAVEYPKEVFASVIRGMASR